MKWLLCSGSPRRKDVLSMILDDFFISIPEIAEKLDEKKLKKSLEKLAYDKAMEGYKNFNSKNGSQDFYDDEIFSIGCDTIVKVKNRILGKPEDENQWKSYLDLLSDNKHEVWSHVVVLKNEKKIISFLEKSKIWFRYISEPEKKRYILSGEGADAAGGYKIQGYGIVFTRKIRGSLSNVIGFPVEKFIKYYKSLSTKR